MKVLFFGDIVARPGRTAVAKILPSWSKKFKPDFLVANGENLAHGDGITPETLKELLALDVDAVTSGNHVFHRKEVVPLLEDASWRLLRPYNMTGKDVPGKGWLLAEKGKMRLAVANLIGITQFKQHKYANPFIAAEEMLSEIWREAPDAPIVLDFHAEATSEKKAMGWFLDGKVAAVICTHTHVPTRDERILPKGTAYITDVGMVGPSDSVLGLSYQPVIENFMREPRSDLDVAEGPVEINAVLVEIDERAKIAKSINHLREIISLE